jgi:hypothetical protein
VYAEMFYETTAEANAGSYLTVSVWLISNCLIGLFTCSEDEFISAVLMRVQAQAATFQLPIGSH